MFPHTVVIIPVTKIKVSFLSLGHLMVSGKMVEENNARRMDTDNDRTGVSILYQAIMNTTAFGVQRSMKGSTVIKELVHM